MARRLGRLATKTGEKCGLWVGSRELLARARNLVEGRRRLQHRYRVHGLLHVSEVTATPLDERFLLRVKQVVEDRLTDAELSVATLASEVAMSARHLQRKLRALTGEPPLELIRRLRLERSRQLLEQGLGNVTEVAFAVGFSDVSSFSRAFRRAYLESPSALLRRGETVSSD